MKRTILLAALAFSQAGLYGCMPPKPEGVDPSIAGEIRPGERRAVKPPPAVDQALLQAPRMDIPGLRAQSLDQRFDLSVNNAPAAQVFSSIVSGTRYSILLHPNVSGMISVNLKDVTVPEALEAIREVYGYEYKMQGTRILVMPIAIQTRIFNVNYLIGERIGRSDLRVTSGAVSDSPGVTTPLPGQPNAPMPLPGSAQASQAGVNDSARIQTETKANFWADLERTLRTIVGTEQGRSVVVNPQAGVVVVRAMPPELRGVETYLKAIESSVGRQVILEAKIIEVTLNGEFQTGINWAAFSSGGFVGGPVSQGTLLQKRGAATGSNLVTGAETFNPIINGTPFPVVNPGIVAAPGNAILNNSIPGGSLFGLAFQTQNFAALLTFLESQGNVQVLSSPRIATINNQKAVLKVGTDQFFLTSISGSTTTTTSSTITGSTVPAFPTITLRPFFSGVALDITPQIDEESNITLHIHPSVSEVETDNRQINLGQGFGAISLPLAKSNVSETDSVVKVVDGNIVAIGGLMKVDLEDNRSGLPGAIDSPVSALFSSTNRKMVKKELVILVKPTVVQSERSWDPDLLETRKRFDALRARPGGAW